MPDTLPERLRASPTSAIMVEAADRIDALESALQWYADMAKQMGKAAIRQDSKVILDLMKTIAVDYGGRARAALAQEKS